VTWDLFTALVQAHLTWLAIVAVIMSAVSAFHYLRVVWGWRLFGQRGPSKRRASAAATS